MEPDYLYRFESVIKWYRVEVTMDPIERHRKGVAWWLFGVSAMVLGMIAVGGLTRLTESGLSMVDWRPLMGVVPPVGESAWNQVFEQYKGLSRVSKVNAGMTLSEFKFIFYFEYGHRVLGRLIGMAFALPALYFGFRGAFLSGIQKPNHCSIFLGWLARFGRLVDGQEWTCGSSRRQSLSIDHSSWARCLLVYRPIVDRI